MTTEQKHIGEKDLKYGGIITDLYTLPNGTKFYVHNGHWKGEIKIDESDNHYILIKGCRPCLIEKANYYFASISIITS